MKRIILALLIVGLAVGCKSKSKTAEKKPKKIEVATDNRIPLNEADPVQKQRAYDFGHRVLNACNTSKFRAFNSSEATPQVIKNTTESKITTTCHKFRLKYGDFKDMTLVEIVRNDKDETNVYRYKAHYSKKIANKEMRVIMNKENKLVAIQTADWKDVYVPMR